MRCFQCFFIFFFFFSSRRRHTRLSGDWSSDVCSSDLSLPGPPVVNVFSPLWPGKGGWSLASQRWLEVNDLGRLVNRYGRRQWHPTPVLLPGKSHGRKSLVGCSPWGRSESGTTERL